MTPAAVSAWHRYFETRDTQILSDLLANDAVFHSPVVHTPQRGKPIVFAYLTAALKVFGNDSFSYVREIIGEQDAMLEFSTELNGIHINGVDIFSWDENSKIVDFKVMLRPLKAINLIHQLMGQALAAQR